MAQPQKKAPIKKKNTISDLKAKMGFGVSVEKGELQNASNADKKIINGSEYYVISSMGTYYADEQTVTAKVNACSVNVNNLTLVKKDGRTWFDSLVCAKLFTLN